jgi:hypothetical protein
VDQKLAATYWALRHLSYGPDIGAEGCQKLAPALLTVATRGEWAEAIAVALPEEREIDHRRGQSGTRAMPNMPAILDGSAHRTTVRPEPA